MENWKEQYEELKKRKNDVNFLIDQYNKGNIIIKKLIITLLGDTRSSKALQFLKTLALSNDNTTQLFLEDIILSIGKLPNSKDTLIDLFAKTKDIQTRKTIILALSLQPDAYLFLKRLYSINPIFRWDIIMALAKFRDPIALKELIKKLHSKDTKILTEALFHLRYYRKSKTIRKAIEKVLINKSTPEIAKVTAIATLGISKYQNATNLIAKFLSSDNEEIVLSSIEALCRIGTQTSLKHVKNFAETHKKYALFIEEILKNLKN